MFIVFIDLTMRQETLKAVIDCLADWEVAGGMVMVNRCVALACKSFVSVAVMLVLVGAVLAQAPHQGRAVRGQVRNQGGVPLKKARPEAADPLGKAAGAAARPVPGTFHYTFRLRSFDGTPLAASFYPSKLASAAPVVMLVHEMGRSRKDFEDPVLDLKGQGLTEHLQGLGYAVLTIDLRWQGQNPRRALSADERPKLMEDLQAGYFFLVDRHNRGDLNLAKLGVIALGDGANLVAAWAFQPGAAITIEGRPSDLNALVLISPKPEGSGYVLGHVTAPLASRVPLLIMTGDHDNPSKDAVQSVRHTVERGRLNKIEFFPSSLHGYKLLRLEPKVTSALVRFLDTTLKNRPAEWEPQYNLTPVTFSDPQLVQNLKLADTKNKAKNQVKNGGPPAENPKPKDAPRQKDANVAPNQPGKDSLSPPARPEKPGNDD